MAHFDPEKMAAYRLAREHTRAVRAFIAACRTRGFSDLVGQLRRSTASVPANVLEAGRDWRPRRQLHYLQIALGSLSESWSHVDCFRDFGLASAGAEHEVRAVQHRLTAVLTVMCKNAEEKMNEEDSRGR